MYKNVKLYSCDNHENGQHWIQIVGYITNECIYLFIFNLDPNITLHPYLISPYKLRILKLSHNKKGQSFVVMLGFCLSFFELVSAAPAKKDMQKPSITTNVWPFFKRYQKFRKIKFGKKLSFDKCDNWIPSTFNVLVSFLHIASISNLAQSLIIQHFSSATFPLLYHTYFYIHLSRFNRSAGVYLDFKLNTFILYSVTSLVEFWGKVSTGSRFLHKHNILLFDFHWLSNNVCSIKFRSKQCCISTVFTTKFNGTDFRSSKSIWLLKSKFKFNNHPDYFFLLI